MCSRTAGSRLKTEKLRATMAPAIWPLRGPAGRPTRDPRFHSIASAAAKARAVLVPEMNTGQLRLEVERVLAGMPVEGIHLFSGEAITPADIAARAAALARGT